MDSKVNPAELAECVAPLCEEDRRAVRRYWEQVRQAPRAVPLAEDGRRERRQARRAVARIAAAGRAAHVLVLVALNTAERSVFGDEAA